MAGSFPGAINQAGILVPAVRSRKAQYNRIYSEHRHRIYSLCFWMTDHELAAEQLATNTFLRAFASSDAPRTEQIDQALLAELRELMVLPDVTRSQTVAAEIPSVRGNVKRVNLERAVVQLPATERLIFL